MSILYLISYTVRDIKMLYMNLDATYSQKNQPEKRGKIIPRPRSIMFVFRCVVKSGLVG